jgi:hypothetical protein
LLTANSLASSSPIPDEAPVTKAVLAIMVNL